MIKSVFLGVALALSSLTPVNAGQQGETFLRGLMIGSGTICTKHSQVRDLQQMGALIDGPLGQRLGIHGTDGRVSQIYASDPTQASILWGGTFISTAGEAMGCSIIEMFIDQYAQDVGPRLTAIMDRAR